MPRSGSRVRVSFPAPNLMEVLDGLRDAPPRRVQNRDHKRFCSFQSITRTDMDTKKTTLAELIDAFVAADRPAPLGASALSGLAFRHGLLLTPAIHDCGDVARLAGYSSRACSWGMRERARASLYFSSSLGKSFPARSLASGPRARHARAARPWPVRSRSDETQNELRVTLRRSREPGHAPG